MKFILAQATTDVPWKYTPPWLFGLFGALCVGLVALLFIHYFKKVFGRRPPIDDEMAALEKKLRSEVYHAKASVRKELVGRIVSLEEKYDQMQLDRERKWAQLTAEYHGLELKITTLTERIANVLKKLEER